MIKEETAHRVGGESFLNTALNEGRVIKKEVDGNTLYFFPRVSVGVHSARTETSRLERSKAITDAGWEKIDSQLEAFGWNIQAKDSDLQASVVYVIKHVE